MANPFQQRSRLRKLTYTCLILGLFTLSLLHRRSLVEPQALRLQLREQSHGEVELTSSAVRLTLIGSRGLATCALWQAAIDKQVKHQWNKLELIVRSITKLQPHFITPWLFQSWNLSFNVAVECDRARDKYFYVARGLELLAEGERRNQGSLEEVAGPEGDSLKFPGNPEMRYYMGFTYQLKIGTSDEQHTMRCLFDMSCIDPRERDPDKLWAVDNRGRQVVDLREFEKLCTNHPRLVRRLRERLDLETPKQVVTFLRDNRDVPSRFEKPAADLAGQPRPTQVRKPREQFPILPPRVPGLPQLPDPEERELLGSFDVYAAAKAWYIYAQEPLPLPSRDPGIEERPYDKVRYRKPKMAAHIFRAYPARAQVYIADTLEDDGWFDDSGWTIKGWFDRRRSGPEGVLRVGREAKYHAGPAWAEAHLAYRDFGSTNGLYFEPEERRALDRKAQLFRARYKVGPYQAVNELRAELRGDGMGESCDAHRMLKLSMDNRHITNFDAYFYQSEVEQTPEAVLTRKQLFDADRKRREAEPRPAYLKYQQALPQWLDLLLSYPGFRRINELQGDSYEVELRYLRLQQDQEAWQLRPQTQCAAQLGLVRLGLSPVVNLPVLELTEDQKKLIIPIRNVRGPFEKYYVYDLFEPQDTLDLQNFLLGLTQGTSPVPLVLTKYQASRMLVTDAAPNVRDPAIWTWHPLIAEDVIDQIRSRLNLNQPQTPPPAGR